MRCTTLAKWWCMTAARIKLNVIRHAVRYMIRTGFAFAAAGREGIDGLSPMVRGTFDPKVTYTRLDIVAFNKCSFIARHDEPGLCPGDGWQLIAAEGACGEKGSPGPRGAQGAKGEKGDPGPSIVGWQIDRAKYQAVPIMSDGGEGPPLELRGLFKQFDDETRG